MIDEKVKLYGEVGSLSLPDFTHLGISLSKQDMADLAHCHTIAHMVLGLILHREVCNRREEVFEIDLPELDHIASKLPDGEADAIREFWSMCFFLVRHFLPDSKVRRYRRTRQVYGREFRGRGWF